jgi:hypothetical protein
MYRLALVGLVAVGVGCGPAVAATVGAPSTAAVLVPAAPVATWPGGTSGNWSGYAGGLSSGKLTEASASWTVPTVEAVKGFSATWVGIDGAGNPDLIQTGTEQDYTNGSFIYRAWWEILPASETVITSLKVHPGDEMTGSVRDRSGTSWVISLEDDTTGKSFSIDKTYKGPGHSAEWIQEAPTSGGVLTLAHYSETGFRDATIATNFGSAGKAHLSFPSMAIAMVNKAGAIISLPSKPAGGDAFNVAYGNEQPAAP